MTTIERRERPALQDLIWSTWPLSTLALELPLSDTMAMRVEEYADDGGLVVRAELPGVDPDKDVTVEIDADRLVITAERREETSEGEKGKPGYHSEFRYGAFRRVVRLPQEIRQEDVTATYADGILEVRVPLPEGPDDSEPITVPVTRRPSSRSGAKGGAREARA